MAQATTIAGTAVYIKVETSTPGTYSHPCLINAARGVTFRTNTNDVFVPDCTNPNDPAWRELEKMGLSVGVSGAGVLDNVLATIQEYTTWLASNTPKSVQVWLGTIGYWEGDFHLTEFAVTGDRGAKAEVSITLESDGIVSAFTAPA